jgi:thiol-disulfide isomerase/thioredoxin
VGFSPTADRICGSTGKTTTRIPCQHPYFMKIRALILSAVAAAGLAAAAAAQAAPKAPEFTHSSQADWLNSKPLRLRELRGKVVLIEFWAFECVNCRRTQPWLHAIQKRYADKEFVIVSVHTPELPEERSTANVRAAVAEQQIANPVMVDGDYSYWNAMKNQYWPAFYVIDKRGRIAARAIGEMHVGQARAAELERAIEAELAADAS